MIDWLPRLVARLPLTVHGKLLLAFLAIVGLLVAVGAAGLEVLNPRLATSPPEAKAKGTHTMEPTYAAFLDEEVAFYYDTLPAGTYDFYFRARATTEGSFTQPPAKAEMMYDAMVVGSSVGAKVMVAR